MGNTRTQMEQQFLQLFPQGNPAGMADQDLQAFINASLSQSTIPGTPFFGTTQGRVQGGFGPLASGPIPTTAPAATTLPAPLTADRSRTLTPPSVPTPPKTMQYMSPTRSGTTQEEMPGYTDAYVTGLQGGGRPTTGLAGFESYLPANVTAPSTSGTRGGAGGYAAPQTTTTTTNPLYSTTNPTLETLLNNLVGNYSTMYPGVMNPSPGVKGNLESFFGGQNPSDVWRNLFGSIYGGAGASTDYLSNSGIWPTMTGNLNYLNQYGLPGNQQLQSEQQALGLKGLAGQLLGGQEGGYGISDLLSQIMYSGLPGQSSITGMVPGQAQFGTNAQSESMNRVLEALGGGGLTNEYVNAMRESVLQPSQEALRGRMNKMGGGVADINSPLFQELQRRNERDFNNQLVSQGYGGYQNLLGQAAGMGQGGISNAMQAFGAVPGAFSPYANLAGNLGSDALAQSLGRFTSGGSLGLQNLNTVANLGMIPYNYGLQAQGQTTNQLLSALNQLLGGANQFMGGQQQFNLGMADLPASLVRAFLSGEQQKSIAELQRQAQSDMATKQLIGSGIGAVASLPWKDIFKGIFG